MSYSFPDNYFDPVRQEELRRQAIADREKKEIEVSRSRPARIYPDKLADGLEPLEYASNNAPVQLILRHLANLNISTAGVEQQLANGEA